MSTADSPNPVALAPSFTLRDLYERASVSGNSMATELDQYLNPDKARLASSSRGSLHSNHSPDELSVHERALSAILQVVTSDVKPTIEHLRVPEPPGGVQEWWARMLSGSINSSPSATDDAARGEFL